MQSKWFWLWLLFLAIPVFSLIAIQVDITTGASIGGGGYDLGPFLYSWLLVIITVAWSLASAAAAVFHRARASRMRALCLTAVGLFTLAMVLVFYGQKLS